MTEPALKHRADAGELAPALVVTALPPSIVSMLVDELRNAHFDIVQAQSVDEAQAALAVRPASVVVLYFPLEPHYAEWVASLRNAEAQPTRRILLLCETDQ